MDVTQEIALLPPKSQRLPFVASLRLTQESQQLLNEAQQQKQQVGDVESNVRINLEAKTLAIGESVFKLYAVEELTPCEAFCPDADNPTSLRRIGDVKTKLRVQVGPQPPAAGESFCCGC